jgi:hypothetical protein
MSGLAPTRTRVSPRKRSTKASSAGSEFVTGAQTFRWITDIVHRQRELIGNNGEVDISDTPRTQL